MRKNRPLCARRHPRPSGTKTGPLVPDINPPPSPGPDQLQTVTSSATNRALASRLQDAGAMGRSLETGN